MERAKGGTPVGIDDPWAYVDRCDYLTDDGRCRAAITGEMGDGLTLATLRRQGYACPVIDDDWGYADCCTFRCTTDSDTCERCGLAERRDGISGDRRPLIEEHHLAYADAGPTSHEITVALCRWCHAKVHQSWGRIDDDVSPDPAAIAEREQRRSREHAELGFTTAMERREEP